MLFEVHVLIFALIASVPAWPLALLRWGVYVPLALSMMWLALDGCPLTKAAGEGESFTRDLYARLVPGISVKTAQRVTTFAMLLITVVGFRRLHGRFCAGAPA